MHNIPWDLITTVIVAILGSSWFANWVQSKSKYSNRVILETVEANAADISRRRVLTFDSEIRKGEKHTKEDFNDVIMDIDKYEAYCKSNPNYHNTRAVLAEEHIKKIYQKCLEENDFLQSFVNSSNLERYRERQVNAYDLDQPDEATIQKPNIINHYQFIQLQTNSDI